jgi:hypothetical protein
MAKPGTTLGHHRNTSSSSVALLRTTDYPDDGEVESPFNSAGQHSQKRTSCLMIKDLRLSSTSPNFLAAVNTAIHDFHIHILTENMFPNDMEARNCILASVQYTCHKDGIPPFKVNEVFYKTVCDGF